MKVLVLFPSMYEAPAAIYWTAPDGTLTSYVPEHHPAMTRARAVLANRDRSVEWEDYFEVLADRFPSEENWEVFEIEDDPQIFLRALRRMAS